VPTNLAPSGLLDSFPQEHITPLSTIVSAFDKFITDESLKGQIVECSQTNHFFRKQVEYPDESTRWLMEESAPYWDKGYAEYYKRMEQAKLEK